MNATESLRQFFNINQSIIDGLYGQAFFTMGIALAFQSYKRTRLSFGKHLRMLAIFGLLHGLVEWGDVFIPVQAAYMSPAFIEGLRWLQLALLIISFGFLLQFGLRMVLRAGPLRTSVGGWTLVVVNVLLAAICSRQPHMTPAAYRSAWECWVRYLVASPGAIASAVGTFQAMAEVRAMALPRLSRWLGLAGLCLLGTAALNLVTVRHHLLVSHAYNYDEVLAVFGIPVQILRTITTIGLLYGMLRTLSVFEVEADRLLRAAQEQKLMEARDELETMERIAITLGSAREPRQAMTVVLAQILPFLRCSFGQIALWENNGFEQYCEVGIREEAERPDQVFSPLFDEVRRTGRVVVRPGAHSAVGIPIRVGSRFLAAAAIYGRKSLAFSDQELQVLDSLGILIGIALENSRLWARVRRREAARTKWIDRVITAQEDERRRISAELHDEVIQSLAAVYRELDLLEESSEPGPLQAGLESARRNTETLIGVLRSYAYNLRPPALDDLGLASSLRRLLDECERRTQIQCQLIVSSSPSRLPRNTEIGLYRITQEAIRNVEKHAGASALTVELGFQPEQVVLRVTDDGKGIAPDARDRQPSPTGGLGILSMQERAALLGGHLELETGPNGGTTVSVRVPWLTPELDEQPQGEAIRCSQSGSY